MVTISAGNEGYTGPFYSSSGSNGAGVISVSAVNVTGTPNVTFSNSQPVAAYFSTWGPTNELLLKPDIAAPGYDIVSTVIDQQYEEMSGTSMSAPYIAGVAALYLGYHGGREVQGPEVAKKVSQRIASSGRSVAWSAGNILLNQTAPPFQVGTGLVDAWKVLHYDTELAAEPFALLDTENFQSNWSANITNSGNESITYTFQLEPQAGTEMLDAYYGIRTLFDLEPAAIVPNVTLPKPIIVPPGDSQIVEYVLPQANKKLKHLLILLLVFILSYLMLMMTIYHYTAEKSGSKVTMERSFPFHMEVCVTHITQPAFQC